MRWCILHCCSIWYYWCTLTYDFFLFFYFLCFSFFAPRLTAPPGVWCRAGDAWSAGTRHGTLRRCRRVWEALSVLLLFYFDRSPRRSLRVWCGSWSFFFHLVFSSEWFCTLCFFSVSSWGRVCRVLRPRAPHLSFFRANVRNNNNNNNHEPHQCHSRMTRSR